MLLHERVTIIICTCDAYEDLWMPFFTLLRRYWDVGEIKIILNTETKDYSFEGLDIQCVHPPREMPYGARMLNALRYVKTDYVLPMLDDFFIRSAVDNGRIEQIIGWMDDDPDIVYFNCDINTAYVDWEVDRYPGFRRLPTGNNYIMSMQAAVWRTHWLKRYWRPDVSPWEWEELCNIGSRKYKNHKYYCLTDIHNTFIDYGYNQKGMGVYRGGWVMEDVQPLFEREGICVDFSKRGAYDPKKAYNILSMEDTRKNRYSQVYRCLGWQELPGYFLFCRYQNMRRRLGKHSEYDYFAYLKKKTQKHFLKKYGMK